MDSISRQPDHTVNALGLLCPLPIIRTAQAVRSLGIGAIVEILSDDRGILEDLPEWCRDTGQELLELRPSHGHWRALVRKIKPL